MTERVADSFEATAMTDAYDSKTHERSRTSGAKPVWDRLAASGVAEVIQTFEPDGNSKYQGQYVVRVRK